MFKKLSKVGLTLSFAYLLVTAYFFYEAFTCSGMYCGFILVLPIMPWNFILDGWVQGSWFVYAMSVLANTVLLYLVGHFLGIGFRKIFKKQNTSVVH